MDDARFVRIAKALADPNRRRMLAEIRAAGPGGLTCSCLVEGSTLSQPTISHHVKTLEVAGLIHMRKHGPYHVLSADETALSAFAAAVVGGRPPRAPRAAASGARSARARRTSGAAATRRGNR